MKSATVDGRHVTMTTATSIEGRRRRRCQSVTTHDARLSDASRPSPATRRASSSSSSLRSPSRKRSRLRDSAASSSSSHDDVNEEKSEPTSLSRLDVFFERLAKSLQTKQAKKFSRDKKPASSATAVNPLHIISQLKLVDNKLKFYEFKSVMIASGFTDDDAGAVLATSNENIKFDDDKENDDKFLRLFQVLLTFCDPIEKIGDDDLILDMNRLALLTAGTVEQSLQTELACSDKGLRHDDAELSLSSRYYTDEELLHYYHSGEEKVMA
jgi:hypothetical protein